MSTASTAATRTRKPRRSYNCGPCKRQKIKCDTRIPCGACKRHNRVDQCLAAPPNPPSPDHRRRVTTLAVSALTDPLPKEVPKTHLLPSLVITGSKYVPINPKPPTSTNNNGAVNTTEVSELKSKISYLNERLYSLESKFQSSEQQQKPAFPTREMTNIDEAKESRSTNLVHYSRSSMDNIPSFEEMDNVLPDEDQLRKLVSFYVKFINPPFNILDSKSITAIIERLISIRQQFQPPQPTVDDWESLALIYIVCSVALLHSPLDLLLQIPKLRSIHPRNDTILYKAATQYSKLLYQRSQQILSIIQYKENPRIIHLQILLITNQVLHKFNKKHLLISLNAEIVSICYILGLQYSSIPQNSLEVETGCKIWWMANLNDQLNSLTNGLPSFIKLDQINNHSGNGLGSGSSGNSLNDNPYTLKAFIPVEATNNYKTTITYITKIVKITNDFPAILLKSPSMSKIEFFQTVIMIDRQLTSFYIPATFSLLNPRNDIVINFQSCYIYFIIMLNRFLIYKSIYFKVNNSPSIWFLMCSIIQNFFKKYMELRRLYDLESNCCHYIQISEFLIKNTIWCFVLSVNMKFSDQSISSSLLLLKPYLEAALCDLRMLSQTVLNPNVKLYEETFKILETLSSVLNDRISHTFNDFNPYNDNFLRSSRVLESFESEVGLIPNNEFLNDYISDVSPHDNVNNTFNMSLYHSNGNRIADKSSWTNLTSFLNESQLEFLQLVGI